MESPILWRITIAAMPQANMPIFGIARRYLRIGMHLMRNSIIYLPPALRGANVSTKERVEYYQIFWPYLLDKWKKYDAHKIAFAPENPLGQWRNMIQKLYNIELRIPGEKRFKR